MSEQLNGADNGNQNPEASDNPSESQTMTPEQLKAETEKLQAEKKKFNEERAGLGRKFQTLNEKFDAYIEEQRELKEAQQYQQSPQYQQPYEPPQPQPDDYMTFGQYEEVTKKKELERLNQMKQYGKIYFKEIQNQVKQADLDEETGGKILEMLTKDGSPFNTRSHAFPDASAQINFRSALLALKEGKKTEPPGRRDNDLPPPGDDGTGRIRKDEEIEMTPEMKEYAKRRNLTDEQVKKYMNKKPAYEGFMY